MAIKGGSARIAFLVMLLASIGARAQPAGEATIGANDIGGEVSGPNGPEAGVWVIARTADLPTGFAKIVATDDTGRFVIPELPAARYEIFVRGYGLVDSDKVAARPGETVALTAKPAPNEAAAAEYYPGVYWYSMLHIPPASEFPLPSGVASQADWIDTIKNGCQSCHALGSRPLRSPSKQLGEFSNSVDLWIRRIQSGQATDAMARVIARLGPDRGLKMFADWTDRIAAGELPFAKPERPQGVERNLVISVWDWGAPTIYLHDAISTDKRHPTVNANGPIYGATEESSDLIPVLDPARNSFRMLKHPYRDPATPTSKDNPVGVSVFWGDQPIWDSHTTTHNPMMDEKGRVWFTARIRPPKNPDYCRDGAANESAGVAPLTDSSRQLSMFDPKTEQWTLIDTCFATHHLEFGYDANDTLWLSAGSPASGVVGWLDVKKFEATGDEVRSQGWTPIIADVVGSGQREAFVMPEEKLEAGKDKWVRAGFYGISPSPEGDVIWGQSMGTGFTSRQQPSLLIRLVPGPNPAKTALSEIFQAPEGAFGMRGVDVDSKGVAWTVLSSGHLGSFDRRRCRSSLSGPSAATGAQCPEGWTLYRFPGPQFKGVDPRGAADHAYYVWVDRFNVLGLGVDTPIAMTNGGEALLALANGKFVTLRVPWPMGFFAKGVDGRIDDPRGGWKGRGLWTTSGTRANFHGEGGKGVLPKVFKLQLRPDPLAH